MNFSSYLWRLLFLVLLIYMHFLEAVKKQNKQYFNGFCNDNFNQCNHACIPNPNNVRQFYCTCRDGYYIQGDGFSCRRTPPKELEMDIEINQISEDKSEPIKLTPKKSTKIVHTVVKRSTRHKSKTPKPVQTLLEGNCSSSACKNGGICQSMKTKKSGLFILCLCRLGFGGQTCDKSTSGIRFPKFISSGYLAFPEQILNELEFRLTLYIKPSPRISGTLLAFKNSALSNNFVFGIENMIFVFRFENQKSRKEIRHQTTLSNSKEIWYKVEIERKGNNGKLSIDNIESTLEPIERQKHSSIKEPQITDKSNEAAGNFICDFCLYLGGHPQLMNKVAKNNDLFGFMESAYSGCIRNFLIDDVEIDMRRMPFYGRAVEGLGIEDCSVGLCESIQCKNNGECQVSEDYQPTCHCILGFSGKMCEKGIIIKMPLFLGEAYASYIGLRGTSRSENRIFMRFKPISENGILLYQGYSKDKRGDFLSIYLINGYPWISYDLGSGTISLRSARSLKLGEWHTIRFQRIGREGILIVNEDDKITGISPGNQVQLTIKQNLLLGGVDSIDSISASLTIKKGFQGCIQMLFIDNQQINLTGGIEKSRNLENCNNHTCGNVKKLCWEDGDCIPDHDDFFCSCRLGYIEANCQTKIDMPGVSYPSFNGSSYLVYTEARIIKRLSDSKFNLTLFINLRISQSNRFLIHATRTNQLNVDHYFSLKINSKSGIDFILNNGAEHIELNLLNNLPILSDHRIKMRKDKKEIQFSFNETFVKTVKLKYNSLSTMDFSKLFIGGTDLSTAISMNMPVKSGMIGCIKRITLDKIEIKAGDANDGRSVARCGSLKA